MDVCLICWLLNFVGMLNMSRCEKLVVDRWCWRRWWWWRRRRRLRLFSLSSLSIICTIGLRLLLWFLSWKTERKEKRERESAQARERERESEKEKRKEMLERWKKKVWLSHQKKSYGKRTPMMSFFSLFSIAWTTIHRRKHKHSFFFLLLSFSSFIHYLHQREERGRDRESWQEKELTILRSLLLVVRVIIFNFDGSLATVKNKQRKRQKNWFSSLSFFSLPLLSPLWLIVY